jgi:NADPH:quinone reductase-like Zn-dependent oxidoreductase
MRSYRLEKLGRVDGIVSHEEPRPRPAPTEALVRVHAASLNRRDALILAGRYPLPSRPGVIPLSDGAGEVVAVGEAVTRVRVGERVTGSYVRTPAWASEVRRLTDGAGADLVVETRGPDTIEQSVRASALYGQIVLLWVVGDEPASLRISDEAYATTMATIRREFVGSRADLVAIRATEDRAVCRRASGRPAGKAEEGSAAVFCGDRRQRGQAGCSGALRCASPNEFWE